MFSEDSVIGLLQGQRTLVVRVSLGRKYGRKQKTLSFVCKAVLTVRRDYWSPTLEMILE